MSENVEITLNGVNVSRCKYLNNSKEGLLCTLYDYDVFYDMRCADNPDCYYKQLQRTTTQYNKVAEQNRSLQKELQQKNQEIKAFKLSENEAEEIIADPEEKMECLEYAAKISNNGLKAATDKAIKLAEVNNVRIKTLKEIEEIIKQRCYVICNCCVYEVCNDKDCADNKILEKIKEAKNDN